MKEIIHIKYQEIVQKASFSAKMCLTIVLLKWTEVFLFLINILFAKA